MLQKAHCALISADYHTPNGYTQPPTQPEQGKTIENNEMNKTKYAQLETLGGRGI
jgi:hypothetical protein